MNDSRENIEGQIWLTASNPRVSAQKQSAQQEMEWIRMLIYSYFFLLFLEGVMRKWVLPQFSDYFLLIRDPLLFFTYLLALKSKCFPWNVYTLSITVLGVLCFMASLLVDKNTILVTCYGARTTFFHLPLIFLMPKILTPKDLHRIGFWTLVIVIPTAMLMVLQYLSPKEAWVNTTPGGQGFQIASIGVGRIRPPGPFSFITGVSEYFALVTAILMISTIHRGIYPTGLIWCAFGALMLGSLVSISRLTISSSALVALGFCVFVLIRPNYTGRLLIAGTVSFITFLVLSQIDSVQEALNTFQQRVELAGQAEGGWSGFMNRVLQIFIEPFENLESTPLIGFGLGVGTNVGSYLLTNEKQFLLAEGEWSRMVLESGPILGFAVIGWRLILFIHLMWSSFSLAFYGYAAPLLLFASASTLLLFGQWGRPTTLGFSVFLTGLCLTAIHHAHEEVVAKWMKERREGPSFTGPSIHAPLK